MKVEYLKLDKIKPYENNPRKNDDAVKYVVNSIKEFGFRNPIIIDKDNVVIAGHTRLKAAEILGMEEIPCVRAEDMTPEQIKAFRIADNKTGEQSGWDLELLKLELEDVDFDMTDFGFGKFELSILTEDMEPDPYDNEMIKEYEEHGEQLLANKRVIITYADEEQERYLLDLLGLEEFKKVVYTAEEIMDENDSY